MNPKVKNILERMLEDALDAMQFALDVNTPETLATDKRNRKAIIMSILNIGELAKQLPQEYRTAHNTIPWENIIRMRERAAHGYHIMNIDVVWDVVINHLPVLAQFLQNQLNSES
ncbi:MAG: DUF86 domain-containing protein [Defluviitaleaceae bacterium]|nr:DUF86 domain-containing protein [Defluviitaleaceae bacterium]